MLMRKLTIAALAAILGVAVGAAPVYATNGYFAHGYGTHHKGLAGVLRRDRRPVRLPGHLRSHAGPGREREQELLHPVPRRQLGGRPDVTNPLLPSLGMCGQGDSSACLGTEVGSGFGIRR
jgi:hypothetical protein